MGCCRCCTKADATCRKVMEPLYAILRVLENIPVIGHLIASFYACSGCKDRAERAGIKATVGIAMVICNCPAELVDESVRKRSEKLISWKMTPRADWMKRHHRKTLRHLCMPASHQSATYKMSGKLAEIPMVEGWSRCQDMSIDSQLYGGVRLLDLRVMTHKADIWTHHQKVVCVKLREILDTVRDFVAENPSEVVVLFITNDGKDVDWMKVHSLLNEFLGKKLIPEHMREMTIGDIVQYGKNVIVSGIPNVAYSWRGIDYRWPNKPSPPEVQDDFVEKMNELNGYNPYFLYWYKMECTVDAATIVRSIGGLPSVCVSCQTSEKFDLLEDVAAATNHRLLNVLTDCNRVPFNFISTDFVSDDIIERILAMNDQNQTGAGPMVAPQALIGSTDNLLQADVRVDPYYRNSDTLDGNERSSLLGSPGDTSTVSTRVGGNSSIVDMSMMSGEHVGQRTEVWETVM